MLPDLRGGCDRGPRRTSWLLCSPAGQPVCTPGVPFSPKEGKDVGFLGDSLSMGSAQMAALPHCPVCWLPHVLCQPQPLRRGLVPSWHSAGQVLAEQVPAGGVRWGPWMGGCQTPTHRSLVSPSLDLASVELSALDYLMAHLGGQPQAPVRDVGGQARAGVHSGPLSLETCSRLGLL